MDDLLFLLGLRGLFAALLQCHRLILLRPHVASFQASGAPKNEPPVNWTALYMLFADQEQWYFLGSDGVEYVSERRWPENTPPSTGKISRWLVSGQYGSTLACHRGTLVGYCTNTASHLISKPFPPNSVRRCTVIKGRKAMYVHVRFRVGFSKVRTS